MVGADDKLVMFDSQNRAGALLQMVQAASRKDGRELLRHWFNNCDALAPWGGELREQFVRVGYVTDTTEKLTFPVTVYRAAWEDDDAEAALSWTTDLEFAERFCKGLKGHRAMFLGLYRNDVDAVIWQATCWSALGYLTSRGESEVIPEVLTDIQTVAKLVSA